MGSYPAEWLGRWRSSAADEYDRYLLRVASSSQSGKGDEDLVDYFVSVETGHMGLTDTATARLRAKASVTAIREQDIN